MVKVESNRDPTFLRKKIGRDHATDFFQSSMFDNMADFCRISIGIIHLMSTQSFLTPLIHLRIPYPVRYQNSRSQPGFTCSKRTTETPENVCYLFNLFKVNNKDTRAMSVVILLLTLSK